MQIPGDDEGDNMEHPSGRRHALLALGASLAWAAGARAQAPTFPNRPIKFIVPFAAGSGGDTSGRFFAEQLGPVIGQPVLVENRPGGSGSLGAVFVKNAPPDGHTVLVAGWSAQTVNPITMRDLAYDPMKDFKPISGLTRSVIGFVVGAGSKYRTMKDVIADAKAGKALNVGTISAGQEIILALLGEIAGVKFVNVPYKSGSQMLTDAIGGQIDLAVEGMTAAGALVNAGKLRALMVAGDNRHPQFPDVPTSAESGFPGYTSYGWSALYVRADTPDPITQQLADAMQKVLASEAANAYARRLGSEIMAMGAANMRRFELSELERFRMVAEKAGIKPE
jgi:tripartite-type tricarboxylate transporter receptor subunit TctC